MTRALIVAMAAVVAAAVPRQTPARDGGATPAVAAGTGVIAGVVVSDETPGQPLRRVVVTLNAADGAVGSTTITDDAGRFSFGRLPPGRFSLVATKAAYVTTHYGGRRPGRAPAVPIPLAAGESRTNLVLRMLRGAVISGRVTDPNSGPVPISSILVREVRGSGPDRIALTPPSWSTFTDDRGAYRIYGLPPGDYVVSVAPPRSFSGDTDIRATGASDLQRALLAIGQAGAGGSGTSPPPPASAVRAAAPVLSYALVYFPGTTDFGAAGVVTVASGEVRSDVDLPIMFLRMSNVAGTVATADGKPLASNTMVTLSGMGPLGPSDSGTQVNAAGGFEFRSLTPGPYALLVRGTAKPEGGMPVPPSLWASMDLSLDGNDVKDLAIALQPGADISGRIVFEGSGATPKPDMSRVRVTLESQSTAGRAFGFFSLLPMQPDANGAFAFAAAGPGSYRLTATIQNPGPVPAWTVKSALLQGRDASDTPVDIPLGATITNAVVTLTDRIAELSGVFRDAKGAPTSDYTVLVFSTDRRDWRRGSRRIAGPIRPGADGRFVIRELPPGEYFLAASMDLDAAEIYALPVLEDLASKATRVTLAEGEKKVQDIRVSGS